ncbi:MAG: metallophosphoesterase [Anaerolineales bacterium]|nr:metallophosphoesterase [Anaerolineales bacterium]
MSEHKFTRRSFLKLFFGSVVGSTAMGFGGYKYASRVEPDWVKVEQVKLTLPRLSPTFNGYTIAQISDIHKDKWMTPARLDPIIEKVNALEADTIAITGDFFSVNPSVYYDEMVASLSKLKAKDFTIGVLGNHDHWTDPVTVRAVLEDSGVNDISNTLKTLKSGNSQLHFAGVDDYWVREARLDLVLEQLPADGCAILLAHEPDFADISAPTRRFDLQISGHSHGGQVNIPIYGPPITPQYGEKYPIGLYEIEEMLLYTNRGVGVIPPRVRFNCRPEITLFKLLSPNA